MRCQGQAISQLHCRDLLCWWLKVQTYCGLPAARSGLSDWAACVQWLGMLRRLGWLPHTHRAAELYYTIHKLVCQVPQPADCSLAGGTVWRLQCGEGHSTAAIIMQPCWDILWPVVLMGSQLLWKQHCHWLRLTIVSAHCTNIGPQTAAFIMQFCWTTLDCKSYSAAFPVWTGLQPS